MYLCMSLIEEVYRDKNYDVLWVEDGLIGVLDGLQAMVQCKNVMPKRIEDIYTLVTLPNFVCKAQQVAYVGGNFYYKGHYIRGDILSFHKGKVLLGDGGVIPIQSGEKMDFDSFLWRVYI